ncbi:MAG TPA: hypothetical protein VFR99_01085 [Marmoricola sp.]|nr:hypothetical protein [Marmoricola sp.]
MTHEKLGRARIGATALGRLHLRVSREGVSEDVILERRWPDADSARAWCEKVVADPASPAQLQEAQVFTERWQHPKSWETRPVRALPDSVQDGRPDGAGGIVWAQAAPVSDSAPVGERF